MKHLRARLAFAFFSLVSIGHSQRPVQPDIVVAADGSGDFKTVQAALDSLPAANNERRIIFIKNGDYNEHVRIEKSFITLLGEDRLKTRIVWEVNDRRFDPNQARDRGNSALTLTNASDVVVDNLTVDNPGAKGGKPFCVYSSGTGTRIVMQNIDVLGRGGDTLSLWSHGMYYHRKLHVTGTYHFLGPRGTCYVRDSVIEVLGPVNNALFNEGKDAEREKLVLQHCELVSKVPFGLGSHFRDAAWYFIDCTFPDTLKPDGKIWIAQSNPDKPQPISAMFKWAPDRVYFANSHGPDYPWLKDNIEKSPAKTASAVDAKWTFSGEWDPENTAPPAVASVAADNDRVRVTFAEPVTVKGQPQVALRGGTSGEYVSGSGTATLVFRAPGGKPTKIELHGGAIVASQAAAQLRSVPDGLVLQAP